MDRKIGILMAMAVSLPLVASAVYAQEAKVTDTKISGAQCVSGHQKQGEKILDQLNLTPEQKQKMQASREAVRTQMKATMSALRQKRQSLKDALKSPAVTRESVQGIMGDIKTLQAKQEELMLDGIFAAKDILTPEQFAKFQQARESRGEHMRKEGGNRRHKEEAH